MYGPAHVEKIQGGVAIHVVDVQTTLFISMGGRKIVMPVSHEKLNKLFCCHVFSDVNIINNSWRSTKRIVERHIFVYYRFRVFFDAGHWSGQCLSLHTEVHSNSDGFMIVGIVFGVIGGTMLIVVMYFVCKTIVCNDSGATKYFKGATIAPYTSTNTFQAAVTTTPTPTPYTHSIEANSNGVLPPSYDSAVNQKEGALPYAAHPPPASGNPAPGIGLTAAGANGGGSERIGVHLQPRSTCTVSSLIRLNLWGERLSPCGCFGL
ncbi:hypothetical protein ACOMHN_027570 [Nucella lapillus]